MSLQVRHEDIFIVVTSGEVGTVVEDVQTKCLTSFHLVYLLIYINHGHQIKQTAENHMKVLRDI